MIVTRTAREPMSQRYKVIVNVPLTHADIVRKALGDAGAGRVARYSHCSFSVRGTGRFTPLAGANPHIGEIGRPETVEEEQIQVDVMRDDMRAVISALKESHPYEEPGYEIYAMEDAEFF